MKFLAVGILLATACIGIATSRSNELSSQSMIHPWSFSEMILKEAISPRQKRQQTPSIDAILQCSADSIEVQCASSYNQDLVNIYAQCGRNDIARLVANQCARDENGQLCGRRLLNALTEFTTLISACQSTISTGTCQDTCRMATQNLQNALGCCAAATFTVSNGSSSDNSLISSALALYSTYARVWATCGVTMDPICSDLPTFTPGNRSPPCTDEQLFTMQLDYTCNPANTQPILAALGRDSNCQLVASALVSSCGQQSNGQYCGVSLLSGQATTAITSFSSNCAGLFSDSSLCIAACSNVFQDLSRDLGCCANTVLPTATSAGYWGRCNVADPGVCRSRLSGASKMAPFSVLVITLVAALLKFVVY